MTSSWVGPKQKSRWWRSLIFSICGPHTAQRHPCIEPRPQPLDEAGAQHQLVADEFGLGRGFLGGGNEELGGAHGGIIGTKTRILACRRVVIPETTVDRLTSSTIFSHEYHLFFG